MSAPSIFNDVLGPVMRGPSSSHSAGALRIGKIARDLMQGQLEHVLVEYDPNGSLVTTHKSQGSDMGLFGGLLGWQANDERLIDYQQHIDNASISIDIKYTDYGASHPNTYKLTLTNKDSIHQLVAISTGGGMIELISLDDAPLAFTGDSYLVLLFCSSQDLARLHQSIKSCISATSTYNITRSEGKQCFISLQSSQPFDNVIIEALSAINQVKGIRQINSVMPILTNPNMNLPFNNSLALEAYCQQNPNITDISSLAILYEQARSGLTESQLMSKMDNIRQVMQAAIDTGLNGTTFEDRLLPAQSPRFLQKKQQGQLLAGGVLNDIVMQVSAIMEAKSAMHPIVAAPTAGSCGAMAGAVIAVANSINASDEQICRALFTAGLIGVFVTKDATFAAEEAGCMAECGTGSGMAAAALVYLAGGSIKQCTSAASMALQNSFGLVCDPIANRVEAPCLGKNVMAASNALSCANMAMADYLQVIPLHEVITAMSKVGQAIPHELCCTALGGLSVTPTAKKLEEQLEGKVAAANIIFYKSC